jgi:hypothetical protein
MLMNEWMVFQLNRYALVADRYCEGRTVVDSKLLIDIVQMDSDSSLGKIQPTPNLLIRQSFGYQFDNLALAFR